METDELTDAVFSLRLLSELLDKVESENLYWKWILIVLHNSLQSFMVAALQHSGRAAIAADKRKDDKQVLKRWEAFLSCSEERDRIREQNKPLVEPRQSDFLGLYENIKLLFGDARFSFLFLTQFRPTDEENQRIKLLNEFRNHFIHYRPGIKAEDILQYPRLVLNGLMLAEYIVSESESLIWPELEDLEEQARRLIPAIRAQASSLDSKFRQAFPDMF